MGKQKPPKPKRPMVTAEESAMFLAALDGVSPLDGRDRIVVPPPPPSPVARVTLPATQKLAIEADGGKYTARAPGVSRSQVDALKKARPDQTLDLHGDTVDKAVPKLHAFLESARRTGWRNVLVIHGKGLHSEVGAPLRDAVIHQLLGDASGYVHALVTATATDGGEGATLVEIRR
jgi:DNA-nicking Smr family endonuclease